MSFWFTVIRQVGRNLRQTWGSQLMTLFTVTLSVLIFAFFYLIYSNMLHFGDKLGDDLRLIVYLEEEPGPELQQQLRKKIEQFDQVESIRFVSRIDAYERFAEQLGDNRGVLDDMPKDFLPPSIEVIPLKTLSSLNQVKLFSSYLRKLAGATKVQYGQEWVERFYNFTRLISIIVALSGILLIMTTIFMVAYTIRLTILGRQDELELLKLVGATNNYIRTPFFLEGLLQGVLGSTFGIASLYILFQWIQNHFSGPGFLNMFEFSFFSPSVSLAIICVSVLLCTLGSYSTMHKFLRI
ncbi:permease-like cell division protein FtsX [Desulforhopalus singaporensis]|uniref:Cell division protein FtsX n=1 Tax=Desulforhopalus singaporensis TaxID=91360 RepID=A0A1H0QNM0_9BACT|nr:permease-like cell division protein FtsX [Desulforhopalus singaporensis]SDP18349.1 cell division protein FtsX [Desulforhopalus singaporensis]